MKRTDGNEFREPRFCCRNISFLFLFLFLFFFFSGLSKLFFVCCKTHELRAIRIFFLLKSESRWWATVETCGQLPIIRNLWIRNFCVIENKSLKYPKEARFDMPRVVRRQICPSLFNTTRSRQLFLASCRWRLDTRTEFLLDRNRRGRSENSVMLKKP